MRRDAERGSGGSREVNPRRADSHHILPGSGTGREQCPRLNVDDHRSGARRPGDSAVHPLDPAARDAHRDFVLADRLIEIDGLDRLPEHRRGDQQPGEGAGNTLDDGPYSHRLFHFASLPRLHAAT